jgi:hypothetical protein
MSADTSIDLTVGEPLTRRSYFTTQKTHMIMDRGAAENECTIYTYLAAAVEAFNPKGNPEHAAIIGRMKRERQIAELTRELKHLDPATQKQIIKNLIK